MSKSKFGTAIKNIITGKKEEEPKEELTPADVNFTKADPPVEETFEEPKEEQPADQSTPPAPEEQPKVEEQPKADPPEEEKIMNFKWKFDFVITTGIMRETVTSEVCTEVDSERVAFGLALNKIISTEKYKRSTGVPRYTQKFTKEKITNE